MSDINNLSADEKRLVIHVSDLVELSQKHYRPYYSDFLNEREVSIALDALKKYGASDYLLWGGYENAERVMLCVYPPYMRPEYSEFPFECISMKYRKADILTHRDFLGSLMSLGIKREVLGDIVVGEGIAYFFIKSELSQYVKAQIGKVGRVGVSLTDETADFESVSQSFEDRETTVSSLRIDSIVSSAAKLGRAKAQQLITSGLVAINFKIVGDTDIRVSSGDKISVRGYGKFVVTFDGALSKKGKYRILISKLK